MCLTHTAPSIAGACRCTTTYLIQQFYRMHWPRLSGLLRCLLLCATFSQPHAVGTHSWPNPDTVAKKYDVVVVGGSRHSAYEELQWIGELEEVLRRYYSAGVRLVGCCFGHQLISKVCWPCCTRPSTKCAGGKGTWRVRTYAAQTAGFAS